MAVADIGRSTTADAFDKKEARRHAERIATAMDAAPISAIHYLILFVAAAGFAFDVLEIALGNILSTVFSSGSSPVDPVKLSWLLAAMYIGAVVGAPLSGMMADKYGKKTLLSAILFVLFVTSTAAALSPNIDWLIFFRLLSGLALGAYPPLVFAYLTDMIPPRRRGFLILLVAAAAGLGPVAITFFVRWMGAWEPLGLEAWRWAFFVGSAGALVTAAAFVFLPESPRWLASRGQALRAERELARFGIKRVSDNTLGVQTGTKDMDEKAPSSQARAFVPIAVLSFLSPWSTVAFPVLMGAILIEKGFQLSDALLYLGISTAGPIVGPVIAGAVLDRIDRRHAVALWASGMLVAGIAFVASLSPVWLMTSGIIFYMLASIQPSTLSLYAAESFPTTRRASMTSHIWAVNRVASAIGLLVLVPMLRGAGIWPMMAVIIGSLLLLVGVVLVFGPQGRARQSVG